MLNLFQKLYELKVGVITLIATLISLGGLGITGWAFVNPDVPLPASDMAFWSGLLLGGTSVVIGICFLWVTRTKVIQSFTRQDLHTAVSVLLVTLGIIMVFGQIF